jgi:1-acyl-sn-glycerol-3-phosphate acyltransferase
MNQTDNSMIEFCRYHSMTSYVYRDFFDDFRPFTEEEAKEALKRLEKSETFLKALGFFFTGKNTKQLKEYLRSIQSINDFQMKIMLPMSKKIEAETTSGITFSGIDRLDKNKAYTYISNHRDIYLDASFNLYVLHNNGFKTGEITFGDNLMKNPLIADVGRINKMFKVYRSGKPKELAEKTAQLSEYIAFTQHVKNESIWIAQRGGRTKDGNDKTQYGVLKMLTAARKKTFAENLKDLRIVPVSISYEYEPNDYLKAREIFLSKKAPYKKAPNEDLKSIIDGILMQKGQVNLHFGKPLSEEFNDLPHHLKTNIQAKAAAEMVDNIMYGNYKLYANNFIAADLLASKPSYDYRYDTEQKAKFEDYMNDRLSKIEFSDPELRTLFLNIYANPVYNLERLQAKSE